jgi:DNA-binding NarL/FixJ family response regulator
MKNPKPIRILVVDDHFMVRMGLSASLNVEPDMEVVAEAGTGEAALEAFREHRPNLVIMDVRLPGMGGADATASLPEGETVVSGGLTAIDTSAAAVIPFVSSIARLVVAFPPVR